MSDCVEPPGGSTEPQQTEAEAPCLLDALVGALDDLDDDVFQRFKLFLMDSTLLGQFEVIRKDKLETEDKPKILKAMMDTYGIFTISVMKTVLERLHQYRILQELSQYPYDLHAVIAACKKELQFRLKSRFQFLVESLSKRGTKMVFNKGFCELLVTEADTGQVHKEHEVRWMERFSRTSVQDTTVQCQDLFKGPTETGQPIRAVLTKGVAGVGKTVLTQKFSLDWAEDKANQDVQLLFHFTFRELNIFQNSEFSLEGLLHHCFKESKGLFSFQCLQLLFILDGLDECRLPLDFSRTRVLTDPTESASVEELLVNLIRGDLLPSARIWITTRPAAANQIPEKCVSMVTEVRGFTDEQKEQYFRKRFTDEQQATAVIAHIKNIRSLYIMSSIPIFCWIISTVLKSILEETEELELPNTLTEMYIQFLVVQAKIKNIKYHGASGADLHWTPETKEMVRSLGKLAFEQLLNGKLIFYNSDLTECGLDAAEIARYSGVFTEVFREERGLYQDKVYCFIHLSVQEFLAALYVHQMFFSSGENLLSPSDSSDPEENLTSPPRSTRSPEVFYRSAVDQALQSPNGHLDLFLRFLLGLSLPTNQWLLPGLLIQTKRTDHKTVKYLKEKLNEKGVSSERSLNLFHCLNELNDRSLLEQIQKYLKRGRLSDTNMSSADWSALSFLLLSSDLKEFDLRKYCPSEKGLLGLLPVVKASTKAILSVCGLSSGSCGRLASVLGSSRLTQLVLCSNDIRDTGVEHLCAGLKSTPCRLQVLRLSSCGLSQGSCAPLASVLGSSPSSLTLLDLSNNELRDTGLELLCEGLRSAPCRLETLRLSGCLITERGGASLASALSSAPSFHLRDLDLSYNHPGPSTELLTTLRAPHGPLHSLSLDPAGERFLVPGPKKYACGLAVDARTAHSRLRLSGNRLEMEASGTLFPFQHLDPEDRFIDCPQALCSSGLRGRCYWEVRWSGEEVEVAVSYRDVPRHGDRSRFGDNDGSWSLRIVKEQFYFFHNKEKTEFPFSVVRSGLLPFVAPAGTVGVFLDADAGALSFYDVSSDGALSRLHTFSCCFSHTLFPAFGAWWPGSSLSW